MAAEPPPARRRVLVADRELAVGELLALGLQGHGFETAVARDGHEALASMSVWLPELLVVDADLASLPGLEVVRRVRALPGPRAGVIVALREPDRLAGFAAGADDEMVKPLGVEELAIRLRIVAERRRPAPPPEPELVHGELRIDLGRRRVEVAGRPIELRRREFDLLAFLVRHPGQAFTREDLLAEVWRAAGGVEPSTVTVHMRRLRVRLEPDPSRPRWLETVRGVGYRFRG